MRRHVTHKRDMHARDGVQVAEHIERVALDGAELVRGVFLVGVREDVRARQHGDAEEGGEGTHVLGGARHLPRGEEGGVRETARVTIE